VGGGSTGRPAAGPREGAGQACDHAATVGSESKGTHQLLDILVIGAGPAGTAAAITAARHGRAVAVVDRATFPRDKTCGDGLTTEALRHLAALGLDPGGVASWAPVADVVLHSPSGRVATLPFPRGHGALGAVATRRDLDAALVDLARSAGADVVEGRALVGLAATADEVTATFADGAKLTARWLVAADGMFSDVRRLVDPAAPPYKGEMHAFRQYFRGWTGDQIHVLFEDDILPGYVWVFPLAGDRANVGFGIHRRPGVTTRHLARLWPDLLARPSVRRVLGDAEPEAPHRAWPIPAAVEDRPLTSGRVLFVGDAASATDPLTGEGIAQALATGTWAAEAVAAAGPAAATAYERRVRRELARDLRFAGRLTAILGHPVGCRASIRAADLTPWTRRSFARWLFEDYPRALLLTPDRWRPGAFGGTGGPAMPTTRVPAPRSV
jgi:geranylgeranyl reductase family protein